MTLHAPVLTTPCEGRYERQDVILSSFASIGRNVSGRRFPHHLPREEAQALALSLSESLASLGYASSLVAELDAYDRSSLAERELYSRPYLLDESNRVALSATSRLWLAFNDGSHLSLRASRPGLDLKGAWEELGALDDELSADVPWAFDPSLGYLQAEASFCGSGLSARVTVHTPALVLTGLAETAYKRVMEAGFIVTGTYACDGASSVFDLRLPPTYREPERAALSRLEAMAGAVADYERRARAQVFEKQPWDALDMIGRALGRAAGARLVTRDESADIISGLRFGLVSGVLEGAGLCRITDLWPTLRAKAPIEGAEDGPSSSASVAAADDRTRPSAPESAVRARMLRAAAASLSYARGYEDV